MSKPLQISRDILRKLETGFDPFFAPRIDDETLRREWLRCGARITARFAKSNPGERPWGFWKFAPAPLRENETELGYLIRLDLLTDEERKLLAAGELADDLEDHEPPALFAIESIRNE